METKIIEILTKEADIKKIVDLMKKISFDRFKKSYHFEFSIMEKLTDEDLIKTTYSRFSFIKSIELRENYKGQQYHSINFEIDDGTYVVISIDFNSRLIINAFHAKTNYKQFEKSLRKNYANKFR